MDKDVILNGDCIEQLRTLPDQCAHLVFADPPYNLQLRRKLTRPDHTNVEGVDDQWDRFASFETYDAFTKAWLTQVKRILKPDGALWTIGSYHNIFRLGVAVQDLGFWIMNDIIWTKTNPMPNFRGTRFANAHETLIWAARDKSSKVTFNYQSLKAGHDDVQMRSDWTLPICTGGERLRENGETLHPAQKPEALLHRILIATTNEGDLVIDPFFGTGTTGAVAKQLGRHFIGIEENAAYVTAAQKRLARIEPLPADAIKPVPTPRKLPRVGFHQVVESGLIQPGADLYSANGKYQAQVCADGSLDTKTFRGSIHRVGAHVQNAAACNGWTFWHYDAGGDRAPIDKLRAKIRSEMAI